jgi:hypothetical protein
MFSSVTDITPCQSGYLQVSLLVAFNFPHFHILHFMC